MSCSNKGTEIILKANDVDGLTTEAKIILNGYEIGDVEDLNITENGTIDIYCTLNPDAQIPKDSKFKIENRDLLGSKRIVVEMGTSLDAINDGDVIQLSKMESTGLGDSDAVKVKGLINLLTGKQKQDSILIELRRLNENLEKQNK